MAKKTTRRPMEEQLRQAIRASGMPQNRICRSARMDEGTLSCFMLGKQESMRLKTAQRLARVLGFELVLDPQKGAKIPSAAAPAKKTAKKATKKATKKTAKKSAKKKARRR